MGSNVFGGESAVELALLLRRHRLVLASFVGAVVVHGLVWSCEGKAPGDVRDATEKTNKVTFRVRPEVPY